MARDKIRDGDRIWREKSKGGARGDDAGRTNLHAYESRRSDEGEAFFSSCIILVLAIVVLSFVFDKYCLIIN